MRALLSTALVGRRRLVAFAISVVVLIGAAIGFGLLERPASSGSAPRSIEAVSERSLADKRAFSEPGAIDGGIVEEEPVAGLDQREVEAARQAARRFLAGYIPYTYGARAPSVIDGATDRLARRLRLSRPRQLGPQAASDGEVIALQTEAGADGIVLVKAIVEDSSRAYEVALTLQRIGGAWKVSGVGG